MKTDVQDIQNHGIEEQFNAALRRKKTANIVLCSIVIVLGILSVIYKVNYEGGFFTCFREMTVNGTVFSILISACLIVLNRWELKNKKEYSAVWLYYLRLSSTVTEAIIIVIVAIGLLIEACFTFFALDNAVIARFDMVNMHLVIPLLVIASFCLNDTPIKVDRKLQRLNGACFITLYAVVMVVLILTNVIPEEKIPYSFLDVRNMPALYILGAIVLVYSICYLFSTLLIRLNFHIYWKSYSVKSMKFKI